MNGISPPNKAKRTTRPPSGGIRRRPSSTSTHCATTALAALVGGATWLGTAQSHEALLLRKAGIGPDRCHILTWVYSGAEVPFDELIDNDIDISVGSLAGIDGVAAGARACEGRFRLRP